MSEPQESMKPVITIKGSKATVEVPTTHVLMNSTAALAPALAEDIMQMIRRGGYDYRRDGDLVEVGGVRRPYRASKLVAICKAANLPVITSPKSRTAIRLKKREERRLRRERAKALRVVKAKPGPKESGLVAAKQAYLKSIDLERSRLMMERAKAQQALDAASAEFDRVEEEIARMEAETNPTEPSSNREAKVE